MSTQLTKIAPAIQGDVIHVYWIMMNECVAAYEAKQHDYQKQGRDPKMADPVLRIQIEGMYRLWNKMTGDDKQPKWLRAE